MYVLVRMCVWGSPGSSSNCESWQFVQTWRWMKVAYPIDIPQRWLSVSQDHMILPLDSWDVFGRWQRWGEGVTQKAMHVRHPGGSSAAGMWGCRGSGTLEWSCLHVSTTTIGVELYRRIEFKLLCRNSRNWRLQPEGQLETHFHRCPPKKNTQWIQWYEYFHIVPLLQE